MMPPNSSREEKVLLKDTVYVDEDEGDDESYEDDDEEYEYEEEEDEKEEGDYFDIHHKYTTTSPPSTTHHLGLGVGARAGETPSLQRIKSWYTPVYDYRTVDLTHKSRFNKKPRFCDGRLSRLSFVCLHFMVVGVVMTAVLVPVILLVVVPGIIRSKVEGFDGDSLQVDRMDINQFTTTGVEFSFKSTIPSFFPIPIYVRTGAMDVVMQANLPSSSLDNTTTTSPSTITMMTVTLPSLYFRVSDPLALDFTSTANFTDPQGMAKLIQMMSRKGGVEGVVLKARTGLTVQVFGITFYRGLQVEKTFVLGGAVKSDFKEVVKGLPGFLKAKNLNSIILNQYKMNQLWTFFPNATSIFPLIAIESLSLAMNDPGILLTTTVTFENPSIMRLPLPPIDLSIALEDTALARIGLKGLNMTPGLNRLDLEMWTLSTLLFSENPTADPNITIGCLGPIRVLSNTTGQWLSQISHPLILRLPLSDITQSLNLTPLRSLLSPSSNGTELLALLSNASLSATVRNTTINAGVVLPIPKFLPLPDRTNVNFGFSAGVGHPDDEEAALTAELGDFDVTTDENAIRVGVVANVKTVNTERAATSLAKTLNPILAYNATPTLIKVAGLDAFNLSTKKSFMWAEKVLKGLVLNVTIPV
ncbi:hypothetical protein BC829DRAFT_401681 [Chytridium lagenaria]|nr:hypothetical protein BC829DRAFT_401681 [Chytridium lagenaria]